MIIEDLTTYKVITHRTISDLNSEGYLLEHIKTGAKVLLLSNDDDNKVFTIGFRTPPSNSTGVPHIMEHSVLCGSKKYPPKDPFVELAKGSMNTFLNAMTYPDKTVYPVASCNNTDFRNLMNVYLDAVFYPNIYTREQIFKQEGWHYEIESPEDELKINGVVYNEMRGVFSSADDMLEREIFDTLFPDTPYAFESGGDPQVIPELTYEEFIDFHKKYYHPSNCYIYLYGDMDMAEQLTFIDEDYLSHFDRISIDSSINLQKPFDAPIQKEIKYSITNDEPMEDNTYLSYTSVIDTSLNKELYLAFQIIEYALLLAPGAILNQTLLDREIGKDITGSYENSTYQPYFSVVAKNSEREKLDEFLSTIKEVFENVSNHGFDQKALLAAINFYEFRYREADFGYYPKGLMYGLQAFDSWLYDSNEPFMHIEENDTFAFLRSQVETGYFEELVRKYLLNNTHSAIVTVVPERGLTAKMDAELAEKLAQYKASLTEEEIDRLVENTHELKAYQEEPSTPEELATIPLLTIEDLRKEAVPFLTEKAEIGSVEVLTHDYFTNGIGYLTLCFDITGMNEEDLPYISILRNFLGLVDTANYGYADLFNVVNMNTGGITFGLPIYNRTDSDSLSIKIEARSKVLYDKLPFAFEMIQEILFTSDFSDKKRVKELFGMLKSRIQTSLPSSGHSTAAVRSMSKCNKAAYINELTSGIAFYRIIEDINDHFDERYEEVVNRINALMKKVFNKTYLLVDYTADSGQNERLMQETQKLINNLADADFVKTEFSPTLKAQNEGFKTSSQVQYVAMAGNYKEEGLPYRGELKVLKTILGYDYLWNNVRVKGGAYGCMNTFGRNGGMFLVSYRDPNLKKTLEVYRKCADFVGSFTSSERDMVKSIIGTIADLDAPMTPSQKGARSMTAYLTGDTFEKIQKERDEILSTTPEKINSLKPYLDALNKQNHICVVGGEEKVNNCKDLFDVIEKI